mgnify:CR=1 FL=1
MNDSDLMLQTIGVGKTFPEANGGVLSILQGISFYVRKGESVSVVGNSGSGKSTLLEICASLLPADSGTVLFDGQDVSRLGDRELSGIRSRKMGFIFQNSLLLGDFTALENVMMPLLIAGAGRQEARYAAVRLLGKVGMGDRLDHRNDTLSGGERQRVAVARSLANSPKMIFADEPTGALDEENAKSIETLLFSLVKETGTTLLLVTHNLAFAHQCDRSFRLYERMLHET